MMEQIIDDRPERLKLQKAVAKGFLVLELLWSIVLLILLVASFKALNFYLAFYFTAQLALAFWLTLSVIRTKLSAGLNLKIVMIKLILVGLLFVLPILFFIGAIIFLIGGGGMC